MKTVSTILLLILFLADGVFTAQSIAKEDEIVKNIKNGNVIEIDKTDIDTPMVFKHFVVGKCEWCDWIYADGIITSSTPNDFLNFIKEARSCKNIVINSTGGDLLAAIELGEIFRNMEATVIVGKTYYDEKGRIEYADNPAAGVCFSAAAYAFLGGVVRVVPLQSKYGVHQFSSKEISGFAVAQDISSILLKYIKRMGVDSDLLELSSRLHPGNPIYILNRTQIVNLKIDNTEPVYEDWVLEPFGSGAIASIKQKPKIINDVIKSAFIYCTYVETKRVFLYLSKPMSQSTYKLLKDQQDMIALYIKIDDIFKLYKPIYSLEKQPDNSYFLLIKVELDLIHLNLLFRDSAQNIVVSNEGPVVTWGFGLDANFPVNNKSRKNIGLALKNCVEQTISK